MVVPKISIIIPCYNVEAFVSKCLESVLNQTYNEWETIVVNDGSTDNTEIIISSFSKSDERIHYYHKQNGGLPNARNYGIEHARGGYIFCLDADDYIAPTCIAEAVTYMDTHPECALFVPSMQIFDSITLKCYPYKGKYCSYRNLLLYGQTATACFKKSDWLRIGGFDESMRQCEDWEFTIRLLYGERPVYTSKTPLYFYRYDNPLSLRKEAGKNLENIMTYIYKKHFDIYSEYFGNPIIVQRKLDNLNWANHRLPQLAHKIQILWQSIYNKVHKNGLDKISCFTNFY